MKIRKQKHAYALMMQFRPRPRVVSGSIVPIKNVKFSRAISAWLLSQQGESA